MKHFVTLFVLAFIAIGLSAQTKEEPAGKLSGNFFIDYYHNTGRDTGFAALANKAVPGEKDVHGLRVRRIYLTYDYRFNSKFSSKFRLESDEANFTTNKSADKANKFGMFVKDAYVKWNYYGNHDVYIGIQGTPAFEVSESVWGNRYIEKTIMDLRGIVPSRDLAVSFRGKLDSAGVFKYWLMYGNNSAGSPESEIHKRYFAQFELTPFKGLSFSIYGDYQSKEPIDNAFVAGEELPNNIFTAAIFVGYKKKDKFNGGVEVYYRSTENGYQLADSYTNANGIGVSVFGTYHFSKKVNAFGRFDYFEPNSHADSEGNTRNLYIAGLAFKPAEKFIISPNIFVESFEKIGDRKVKSSVTPRVTVSWAF